MGLFHSKQKSQQKPDDAAGDQQHFFDEYFREELRNHGRWYFEKIISENGAAFKEDLDATIAEVKTELQQHVTTQLDTAVQQLNSELKAHVTAKLDEQFSEYTKSVKGAQDVALQSMIRGAEVLREQHQQLTQTLQKNVADQEAMLGGVFEENKAAITTMKESQAQALQWLTASVKALQEQHQQIAQALQKNVADQEAMLIESFEQNMAAVVEHYLLGALGDQYDLKAQLPSIIQQMEANKQAMTDDMKL